MQEIASYDPYAIKQIEFFVEKRTKYATLKSLIISLTIFALTIGVNYQSLNDIWTPRSELSIQSSNRRTSTEQLTSSYVCAISKTLVDKVANSTFAVLDKTVNLTTSTFSLTNKFDNINQIKAIANGRNFQCYDFQGGLLNTNMNLKLTISGLADVIYKTYTVSEFLGTQKSNYYSLVTPATQKFTYVFHTKKIKAIIRDSLLVSYQPEQIIAISNEIRIVGTSAADNMTSIQFYSEDFKENQLTQQVIISRRNIGQILGNFFSWLTIFILIFTFLIAPIVDFNFKLDLCKKIYDNKGIESMTVSVLTFLRYNVSLVKKGIFEQEDILQEAFEKLEKDLNILHLLKKQSTMIKLIGERKEIDIKLQEPDQKQEKDQMSERQGQLFVDKQLLSSESLQKLDSAQSEEKIFQVTKDNNFQKNNIFKILIKNLDIGQTAISLLANKGRGYRTSWSTILTAVFMVAVFVFLIVAGVLTISTNSQVKTMLEDRILSQSQTKSIVINPSDMIFRALKTVPADNFVLQVVIINQNTEIIQTVSLLSGSNCDSYVSGLNQVVGSGWLCLAQPIRLFSTGKYSKRMLGIRFTFPTALGFTSSKIEITYRQTILMQQDLTSKITQIKAAFQSSSLYIYELQIMIQETSSDTQTYWTSYKSYSTLQATFKGFAFQPLSEYQKILQTQTTIWDVIDTSWGIFILTFSILLAKITSYLNVRERSKITVEEQNQSRNDIVSIISAQHELQTKVFPDELKSAKYYFKKQALSDQNQEN